MKALIADGPRAGDWVEYSGPAEMLQMCAPGGPEHDRKVLYRPARMILLDRAITVLSSQPPSEELQRALAPYLLSADVLVNGAQQ